MTTKCCIGFQIYIIFYDRIINDRVARNFKEAIHLSVDAGIDMHMHGPNFPELVVELDTRSGDELSHC